GAPPVSSRGPGLRRSGDDRSTSAVRPWRIASIIGNLVTDRSVGSGDGRESNPRAPPSGGRWPIRGGVATESLAESPGGHGGRILPGRGLGVRERVAHTPGAGDHGASPVGDG